MRTGGVPGRDAAIQRRFAEIKIAGDRRASRRMFLGLALGGSAGVAVGSIGVLMTSRDRDRDDTSTTAAPNAQVTPADLERALRLAAGPTPELVRGAPLFLSVVELIPEDDPRLWLGVGKLIHVATAKQTAEPDRLRRRLQHLGRIRQPPTFMAPWFEMLRAHK